MFFVVLFVDFPEDYY